MDVIFNLENGACFTIEIGYFDTVGEIKEKVEKYKGIVASRQTFVFNGMVLEDDWDVERCVLLDRSRVELIMKPKPELYSFEDYYYRVKEDRKLPTENEKHSGIMRGKMDGLEFYVTKIVLAGIDVEVWVPVDLEKSMEEINCGTH